MQSAGRKRTNWRGAVRVTIVTPSFNKAATLELTIRSVLAQSYGDVEYIIVDGGSNDQTAHILDQYKGHEKIAAIISEPDKGQADAINKGFGMAQGEIVGWINADDLLSPMAVEAAVRVFRENRNAVISYGDIDVVDGAGETFRQIRACPDVNRNSLLNENYDVYQPGSFYRREAVEKVGYLDESFEYCMDLDLWLKLLQRGTAHHVGGVVASFRMTPDTKTATGGMKFISEIHRALVRYGAKPFGSARRKLYWYGVKRFIKERLTQ